MGYKFSLQQQHSIQSLSFHFNQLFQSLINNQQFNHQHKSTNSAARLLFVEERRRGKQAEAEKKGSFFAAEWLCGRGASGP